MAPMFLPHKMEQIMTAQAKTQAVPAELSIFDVKELYDLAYDIKAKDGDDARFKQVMAEALQLDMAYRRQLAQKIDYKEQKEIKSIETHSESTQVA